MITVERRITTPPPKKKNITENKKKTKEQVRQQGRITHLQRRRYMKRNTSIRTPHGKTPPKKPCHETTGIPLFFPVFWPPLRALRRSKKNLRIIFRRRKKTPTSEKSAENREHKNRNPIFPCFFDEKGRVNKRPAFFDRAWSTATFSDPLFWEASFEGSVYASDAILQK